MVSQIFLCRQVQEYFENTYNLDELLFTAVTGACTFSRIVAHCSLGALWLTVITSSVRKSGLTLNVFSLPTDEKYLYKCPDRLRLPLIFYLAHPATLYVNKLLLASLISVSHTASKLSSNTYGHAMKLR